MADRESLIRVAARWVALALAGNWVEEFFVSANLMDAVSAAAAVLIEDLGGRAVRSSFSSAITAAGISVPDVVGWACLVEASARAL